jgi:ABC-type uncharacterized transport system permease subunit
MNLLAPLAVLLYLAAGTAIAVGDYRAVATLRKVGMVSALVAAFLHASALFQVMATPVGWDVNFFHTLSLAALMIVSVLLLTSPWSQTLETGIIAFPGAALCVALQWLLSPDPLVLTQVSIMLEAHVFTSLLAYSLLSIAAINALMLAAQDYALRHPRPLRQLELLPPLAVIERVMFQLIAAGWAVLTLSLLTGLVFIDNLFDQHLVHKTALSLLSWILFAALLAGRYWLGWRGRRAVNWTLAAMVVLALAYFGSKLVLEVLLDRTWMIPAGA